MPPVALLTARWPKIWPSLCKLRNRECTIHDYNDTADRTAGLKSVRRGWKGGYPAVAGGPPRRSGRWGTGAVRRRFSAWDMAGPSTPPGADGRHDRRLVDGVGDGPDWGN